MFYPGNIPRIPIQIEMYSSKMLRDTIILVMGYINSTDSESTWTLNVWHNISAIFRNMILYRLSWNLPRIQVLCQIFEGIGTKSFTCLIILHRSLVH